MANPSHFKKLLQKYGFIVNRDGTAAAGGVGHGVLVGEHRTAEDRLLCRLEGRLARDLCNVPLRAVAGTFTWLRLYYMIILLLINIIHNYYF